MTGSATLSAQDDPQTRLIYIKRDSILYEGRDIIKTSEIGGRFPSDIVIGTVVSAYPESTGTSMTAVIDPAVDVLSVRNVFVIKDFRGKGAEVVDGQQQIDILTDGASDVNENASSTSFDPSSEDAVLPDETDGSGSESSIAGGNADG